MKIEHPKMLLVEGKDEEYFFDALLKHINITDIQILSTGGKDKFNTDFDIINTFSGFEKVLSIGITRDADNTRDGAVTSIQHQLKKHGLPVPLRHSETKENNGRKVGIFILPGAEQGMLETLVLDSVSDEDVLVCSDKYISDLKDILTSKGKEANFPRNIHKARAHAYLAGMKKLIPSVGLATKKGYFNLNSPSLDDIKDFLRRL